jgi:hypothetical protein
MPAIPRRRHLASAAAGVVALAMLAATPALGAYSLSEPVATPLDQTVRQMLATEQTGDGVPDLVVSRARDIAVFAGDGAGRFLPRDTAAAGTDPFGLAAADLDGDGQEDVAVADLQRDGGVAAALTDGRGGFRGIVPTSTGAGAIAVAAGDFDDDGVRDLAAIRGRGSSLSILLGQGDGRFAEAPGPALATGNSPWRLSLGDYNRDLRQDIAVMNNLSGGVQVYFGAGRGTFRGPLELPALSAFAIASGDLDGNLTQDIVVALGAGTVTVFSGDGRGSFAALPSIAIGTTGTPSSAAVADIDGDGAQDIALGIANAGFGRLTVLLGDGAGGFAGSSVRDLPASAPDNLTVADVDGDRRCDLVASLQPASIQVYTGAASGAAVSDAHDVCRDRVKEPVGAQDVTVPTRPLRVAPGRVVPVRYAVSEAAVVLGTLRRGARGKRVARTRGATVDAGRHSMRVRAPRRPGAYSLTVAAGNLDGAIDRGRVRLVVRPRKGGAR